MEAPNKQIISNPEIQSEETQEILGIMPNWLIQYGSSVIFFIVISILALSWLIKYPDKITGKVTLTMQNAPIRLVSNKSGQLKLLINNGMHVSSGESLAEIGNVTDRIGINSLSTFIEDLDSLILADLFHNLIDVPHPKEDLVFGNIQNEYNQLINLINEYDHFLNSQYFDNQTKALEMQLRYYNDLAAISKNQIKISEEELIDTQTKLDAFEKLNEGGHISMIELNDIKNELRQKKQALSNSNKDYISNKNSATDYERQLYNLAFDKTNKQEKYIQSIKQTLRAIRNKIDEWQRDYTLIAPISGVVNFIETWEQNQYVKSNTEIFIIIPENRDYIAIAEGFSEGFGKIEVGQEVQIKLNDFPSHEYGFIKGVVSQVANISTGQIVYNDNPLNTKSKYRIAIQLNQGPLTTYNKKIEFKPEMLGTAEIITKKYRLIERIFNKIRQKLD